MTAAFKDHFSGHTELYTRYRPTYPAALFAFLAGLVPDHDCAWDCATGNGQAAIGLSAHFTRMVATDASAEQIAHAPARPGIDYRVAPACDSGLADASVALVTVAQALHWFDVEAFYAEARRVLKPCGVLAVWSYGLTRVNADVDAVVDRLFGPVTGAYWPPERRLVDEGYASLPFPFATLAVPPFEMRMQWRCDRFANYLRTWSGVQRYWKATGRDPVGEIEPALREAWGDPDAARAVTWPLLVKAGRNGACRGL